MEQPDEKILKNSSKKFHVNDVVAFFGITPRILKHYETTGVLSPERSDRNGYREYTAEDVAKIQTAEQLKHINLSTREIGEFFSGDLDIQKKRDELADLRESIDRLIDIFDLEISTGKPQFYFSEQTSYLCFIKTYLLSGNVVRRYYEARDAYSQAIQSGYKCDFRHTFFYTYENLFPLPDPETDEENANKLFPDSALKNETKIYRVCVPVIAPKNNADKKSASDVTQNKNISIVTRKKSFTLKYAGEAYGAGKMYYLLQNEAEKRGIALNGNVWSVSLTGPNRKNKKQTYTLIIGAELK